MFWFILFFILTKKIKNWWTLTIDFYLLLCENEKLKTKFEIHNKYQLKIKKLAMFWICVKNKSQGSILNFVFQFIKKMKWYFRYADFKSLLQVSEFFQNHLKHLPAHPCETFGIHFHFHILEQIYNFLFNQYQHFLYFLLYTNSVSKKKSFLYTSHLKNQKDNSDHKIHIFFLSFFSIIVLS